MLMLYTKLLERFRLENKLFSPSSSNNLMARLQHSADLKQLWGLILANIVAISCLGGLLVLMSEEPAYMVLSLAITLCAAVVVITTGYICWYLASLNQQAQLVISGVEHLNYGFMITDKSEKIQFYNSKIAQSLGSLDHLSLDQITHTKIHPDSQSIFLRMRQSALAKQKETGFILVGNEQENPHLWKIEVSILNEDPQVICWVFSSADAAENSLDTTTSHTSFRDLFDQAPTGIVTLDDQGNIKTANSFFRSHLLKQDLKLETSFFDLLMSDCKQQITDAIQKTMSDQPVTIPLEIQFIGTPNTQISAYISKLTLSDKQGIILHFFDNSPQKQLHIQLAQSQKMQAMGQLAGGIAHDFNNLLTAIIGFCDLLLLRHSPGDQSFTDIMQIKQNSNRAANLVRQLLAFSKQQTLQPQMLNVSEILTEVSVLLQRLVGVNVNLSIIHGRDLGVIKVDKGQFEQVIINLVINARDAMNEKGIINVKSSNMNYSEDTHVGHDIIPKGNYVEIEVDDNGCGISEENMSRIFDPFFSTKELGRGTGLGLSTVYGIVKQTGGYIVVNSELGKGTNFKVIFPYFSPHETTIDHEKGKPTENSADLTGYGSILLVEDEDAVRLFGARALRDKGYRVVEARDGQEALNYLESIENEPENKIDLLITDVVMPVMDGVELVKQVHQKLPDLDIIYISGYAEDSFRKKVGQDTNIHFLPKPFSLKELARKVKDVINGQKSETSP